ncbi:ABC transporter ATP-binding protein [Rhodopirellula sp. MGV]|uniref:ABC transporter ATP-binding protein n=1 Tax=Rhodopirellula sp. MGV TaxID=2023130 RepID=UPI000B976FF1|nr:ABC transporter ATP-binding protein [Rhodopirellula sp. MGV]OYP36412.1 ABC transporter permease [Rhodopirellula sp. MGV]PNY36839.1 ABC transporter ATP-binding protein [Rhodopirellula baltica]
MDGSVTSPFARVLRLAVRRWWALIGIVLSSLAIAVLWSANISAVLPMVDIVFAGKSVAQYVDETIETNEQRAVEIRELLATDSHESPSELQTELERATSRAEWYALAKPYVDAYAPRTAFGTLLAILTFLVVGTALKLIALVANMMWVQYVAGRTSIDLRELFFRKALHLDLDNFGENGSADLTARLTNDVSLVNNGVATLLGKMTREPLKMIACLCGAAIVCSRLLLLVMIVMPILAIVMSKLSRAIRRASRRAMEEMSQLYGMLNDSFSGIRLIKASNTQAFERARLRRGSLAYYYRSMKMEFYNTLARGTTEMMGITTVSLAILAGGYLVLTKQTHLFGLRITTEPLQQGEVFLFFSFLIGASDPARKLADVWSGLQRGIAASNRVMEIIDQDVRVQDPVSAKTVARPHSHIRFDDVQFQYSSGPQVLRGIDLTIPHGETVAIVGPNGSGKSTIISLLCRFDDPQSGQVLLNDVPINEMRTRDLRKRIALVTQRTVIFEDTIENNIRYGCPGASLDEVIHAAKLAFADDFICKKTPDGYQTLLGVDGMRLSGGQMQRIALARAFLRNPDILILDEATSQIDLESEQLIHEALRKFLVGRTGVMITHRSSTLAMADRIVVIEQGRVAAAGDHAHLVDQNRFYRSLCGSEVREVA